MWNPEKLSQSVVRKSILAKAEKVIVKETAALLKNVNKVRADYKSMDPMQTSPKRRTAKRLQYEALCEQMDMLERELEEVKGWEL